MFAITSAKPTRRSVPPIPGRESFAGPAVHTANWVRDPPDVQGKRVAVIGTGASSMQLLRTTAEKASEVTVRV